jgi:hypothetical protein
VFEVSVRDLIAVRGKSDLDADFMGVAEAAPRIGAQVEGSRPGRSAGYAGAYAHEHAADGHGLRAAGHRRGRHVSRLL